jgi:hypothetical protein
LTQNTNYAQVFSKILSVTIAMQGAPQVALISCTGI